MRSLKASLRNDYYSSNVRKRNISRIGQALIALALIALVSVVLGAVPANSLHSLDKYVNSKNLASPGLLVINPVNGEVIAQNSPESLRVPASVLKLISTTSALHFLGPEKSFTTKIFSTDEPDSFLIKGTLDPWLTSNLTQSKKNGQKFLPSLVSKANQADKKKLKIYYSGLFEKDIYNLNLNLKAKKIRATFKKIDSSQASLVVREEIASLTSLPVSEMVKFVILWSDNTLADRLAKAAARKLGYGTSIKALNQTFKQAMDELGVDSSGMKAFDGSGLSKSNRVSAKTIVNLLSKIRNNPTYQSIYEGLPVGGLTGTLQKRFLETAPHAVGHVHAKTGWVNRSVTMAGYVDDGTTEYAFAILADGITPTFSSRNRARAAMDRLLGVIVKGIH
jgi:D-alanyl-D-alanine carboxypeptidase/D-alanyl-D-alanine-endopeptidase (penicillin-binding protein 4)